MMTSLIVASISGALLAVLICKGIRLRLWLEVVSGLSGVFGTWTSAILAGSSAWPLAGLAVGFLAVVAYVRTHGPITEAKA